MSKENLSAYIVPMDDHGRLAWISGFTGSSGKVIITMTQVFFSIKPGYWEKGSTAKKST
jgi:hypothetical protein